MERESQVTKFQATQNFWNLIVKLLQKRDVDVSARFQTWISACRNELRQTGAEYDLETLRKAGCSPLILCCCFWAFKFFPAFNADWHKIMGDRRQREHHIRELNSTADLIESLFKIAKVDPEREKKLWPDENLTLPSKMVADLRMYAMLIGAFDNLSRETNVRTPLDLPRFLLVEYVHLRTERWHDREVSALLQAGDPNGNHDENSQKMWRTRNYEKLHKHYGPFADLLNVLAEIISRQERNENSKS
jgi:hypothetical protein